MRELGGGEKEKFLKKCARGRGRIRSEWDFFFLRVLLFLS